jgi:hypothetical protein
MTMSRDIFSILDTKLPFGIISRRDLGRGIFGLVGLEEKMEMETNEIRLLSSIDGFGDE